MFPLPGQDRWNRESRDMTPPPKHRGGLSNPSRSVLTPARLPPNPQGAVPGSPEPPRPRTVNGNDRPVPAGPVQPGCPRHGLRSRGGVLREKRMEEVQRLLRGRSPTPNNGAHASHLSCHNKSAVTETFHE